MIHTVHFLCPVTQSTVTWLQDGCLKAVMNGAKTIQIHISSQGGDLVAGFTAYHFLKSLPVKLITHNISNVESVANVIFMAGSERRANPGSRFLLHPLHWGFNSPCADHDRVREWTNCLDNDLERFVDILNSNCTISDNNIDWKSIIGSATIADATTAASLGMVHSVVQATLEGSAANWWVTC